MSKQSIAQLFDLNGKGAIVTGGAKGIGQGIAFRLAEAGASVMITDIDLKAANETVEEIKASGGKAKAISADAGNAADAKKVVQATLDAFSSVDILVNNAGTLTLTAALKVTEERWDKTLNVNLKGVFFYSQAAAQAMIKIGHGGKIINIASMDTVRPVWGGACYDASKGGVGMLTKVLALELAHHNILVNAVAPGGILTPGAKEGPLLLEAKYTKSFEARIALGRFGESDDIAKVVLFLASSAADYMTGSLVWVDGGYLLT